MHTTTEWIFIGFTLFWLAIPWALVALGWRKWIRTRTQGNPLEDFIDDPAFLIGQTLASISCCALAALFIPAGLQLHIKALDYGLAVSAVSALIGTFVMPFSIRRVKWLGFASCLLNAGLIFTFVVIESA